MSPSSPPSQPLHVRLMEHSILLQMMADGETRLCREDVRQIAMLLHLAALEVANQATEEGRERAR